MPVGFNQPIPGENYTSDTKNYPWHRPPEFTDLDKAIEMTFKKLLSKKGSLGIITMLENGFDIATLTDIYVTAGIGAGKWTPDFALLLAGPVAHIIYLMGKGYGIDVELGVDDDFKGPTKSFFDGLKKVNEKKVAEVAASVDEDLVLGAVKDAGGLEEASGFMGMGEGPSPEEMTEGTVEKDVEEMI